MAVNGNYISIKEIMYRVKRHRLMADANYSDMALDILDVIKSLGTPLAYNSCIKYIPITKYRSQLPKDILYIESVELKEGDQHTPMQYAVSNSGGVWNSVSAAGRKIVSRLTYTIKRNFIYTDIEHGIIALKFKQIVLDEDGYPMIPDNISLIRAIEAFVKWKHFDIKNDLGEVPIGIVEKANQEYTWYIGQAISSLQMPSVDEMESIKNALIRFIPNFRAHSEAFDYEHLTRVK